MLDWLTVIFLFYSFIALYMMFMYLLIYVPNRNNFFKYPRPKKNYSLSIVVPCYNGGKDIGNTIEALLSSDYKYLKKIIVVDDCSTDDSWKIMKRYARKYSRVKAVQTPKNTGNAAGAKNYGSKFVKTELIGFTDDDSFPRKESIRKMVGFFNDEKIAAVTSMIFVKKRERLIEKLQAIEYKIIAFTRKLLSFVGGVYVTPGPLAIYKKKAFDHIGGFDVKNLTEDIEITWHLVSKNYEVQMCVPARVYTVAPNRVKDWFKQRIRWNLGGIQSINKHKGAFLRKGMLGSFILPLFIFSWLIGIFGLFVLLYRIVRTIVIRYLSTVYSIQAQTAILRLNEINLTPNILVFFGIMIFVFSIFFVVIALRYSKEQDFKKHGFFSIVIYMFFYLLSYPVILVISLTKFLRGKTTW